MNFNKAIIIGNLTRDPETRTTPSGQTVTSFSIATNRIWNDAAGARQQAVEYHNIVAWGKLGDVAARYLSKGKMAMVEGRIQTRSWTGQDGVKRYRTEIVAESMQLGPRGGIGNEGQRKESSAQAPNATPEELPTVDANEPISEEKEIEIKDIPF